MKKTLIQHYLFILFGVSFLTAFSQDNASLRFEDKVRMREAMDISKKFGDSIWDGFNKPPFTIILVTDDYEYLINHPYPSKDFKLLGDDEFLNAKVHFRPQQFSKSFLATFPAVNGVNCIVIGTPENTGLNSTQWIITLLHERFHQYQYTSPNYHKEALALGLSNGDESGMWQLNYPFPYEGKLVNKKYEKYTRYLVKAVENRTSKNWDRVYRKLMKRKNNFKKALSKNDYKYISFQWYQEGVARYTEYAFLELLQNYQPSKEVLSLNNFISFNDYKDQFCNKHIANVVRLKLSEIKRVTVYDVGFAEALIVEKQNPNWKKMYLKEKFNLDKLYKLLSIYQQK